MNLKKKKKKKKRVVATAEFDFEAENPMELSIRFANNSRKYIASFPKINIISISPSNFFVNVYLFYKNVIVAALETW